MSDSSDAEEQLVSDGSEDGNQMPVGSGDNPSIPMFETPSNTPSQRKKIESRETAKGATSCFGGCMQMPRFPSLGLEDVKNADFGRMIGAEILGTALLVFFGCGSVLTSISNFLSGTFQYFEDGSTHTIVLLGHIQTKHGEPETEPIRPLHIAFAFGMIVATAAQALGHISGAHLNPAVSFALMIAGKCSLLKTLCYVIAQCIGSILGASMLYLSSKHVRTVNKNFIPTGKPSLLDEEFVVWSMGATTLANGVGPLSGFLMEFILTFLLAFTVVAVCDDLRKDVKGSAPLAIGIAVCVTHFTGIRFTGASVNPARSLGPAIFSGSENRWDHHWVYWLGPIAGGIEAGLIYSVFFAETKNDSSQIDTKSPMPVRASQPAQVAKSAA